jgi:hypothetical protein
MRDCFENRSPGSAGGPPAYAAETSRSKGRALPGAANIFMHHKVRHERMKDGFEKENMLCDGQMQIK